MNIRAVTVFFTGPADLAEAASLAHQGAERLRQAGYTVQTLRAASPPWPDLCSPAEAPAFLSALTAQAASARIDYLAAGPVRLSDGDACLQAIPGILAATENLFLSAQIASTEGGASLKRIQQMGEVIAQVATLRPDGFANLRLAAAACVPPGGPFFPAAYAAPGAASMAVATESADLPLQAAAEAADLADFQRRLTDLVEQHAQAITQALAGLAFGGIDFSFAPFPSPQRSIGAALEALGLPRFGLAGSLATSATLTDALDRASFHKAGFNGLMLPVLEDPVLAARQLTLADLLMCSAVCGTGLDTVPLPGDASPQALAAVLLDVAALSLRLGKPLTARLMPIPGLQAGDLAHFDFDFFVPGQVLALPAAPLNALLNGGGNLVLNPRFPRL